MAVDLIEEIRKIQNMLDALTLDPDKWKVIPVEVRRLLSDARFKLDQSYLELYDEEEPRELGVPQTRFGSNWEAPPVV